MRRVVGSLAFALERAAALTATTGTQYQVFACLGTACPTPGRHWLLEPLVGQGVKA